MSQFKQIQVLKTPKPGQVLSDSALYWKNFEFPTMINEYGGINHIDVSNLKPNFIAATHASRVCKINTFSHLLSYFFYSQNDYFQKNYRFIFTIR